MPAPGAAPAVPQVVYTDHPDGFAHTTSSIRKVAELIREGQLSFPIVRLARRIVHDVPSKRYASELQALYVWAREHVRYRKDPIGAEWLQSAERTVAERAGDCDDLTILIGSLAGALGHAWRLLTVGPTPTRQAHIAIQVSTDGGASWLTLDPVMEPPQSTTALRTDVGAFGQTPRAPSVRLWDQRGEPMQLGSYPSPELKSLWLWQPYFPMGPYAQLPQRGQADPRYRSAGAPGAPTAIMSGLGALNAGMNGCCSLGDPVYLYLDDRGVDTSRADAMGGYPYKLGSIWGSIKKIGKGVAHAASGAVRAVGKVAKAVVKSPIGKVAAPVLALNVDPKLKALRNAGLKAIPLPQAQALLKVGTAAEKAAAAAVAKPKPKPASGSAAGHGLPRPPTIAHLTRGMARTTPAPVNIVNRIVAPAVVKAASSSAPESDAWKKPHPELRKRYPSNARQTYDARSGKFHVFIPHAGGAMSGGRMGALVPTLTLSLGAAAVGTNPTVGSQYAAAAYAQGAVNAVRKFIASRADKRPPGKALPEVQAFQLADAARSGGGVKLKADGLWGNNTRAAAAYYLQTSVTSLPANLPALNTALTWTPPTAPAAAPAPVLAPPSVPAAVRPPAAVAAPAASSSAPPGYVQVGTESQNPGLPPIGAPSSSSSSAGPAAPVSSSPLQLPVTSSVPAIPMRPEPVPGFQPPGSVTYEAPPSPSPAPMAPGAPTLIIHAPPQAAQTPQAPVMAVASPPALPPPPLPAGPGYAPGPVLSRETGGRGSSSSGKWLPWLMLFYCMRKA